MSKEKQVANALEEGVHLFASQRQKGSEIRARSKEAYGDLIDAHLLGMGVIASAISAVNSKPGKTEGDLSQLLSLTASFIQGIDTCETTISEGYYVSATALLKQEMETIAAIKEVRNKSRKSGTTPNVKSFNDLAVVYGDLNKIAHVGDANVMQNLISIETSEKQAGAPLFPVFNSEMAMFLYGLHVVFITMIAFEVGLVLESLYGVGLEEFHEDMLGRSARILQNEGWLPDTTGN